MTQATPAATATTLAIEKYRKKRDEGDEDYIDESIGGGGAVPAQKRPSRGGAKPNYAGQDEDPEDERQVERKQKRAPKRKTTTTKAKNKTKGKTESKGKRSRKRSASIDQPPASGDDYADMPALEKPPTVRTRARAKTQLNKEEEKQGAKGKKQKKAKVKSELPVVKKQRNKRAKSKQSEPESEPEPKFEPKPELEPEPEPEPEPKPEPEAAQEAPIRSVKREQSPAENKEEHQREEEKAEPPQQARSIKARSARAASARARSVEPQKVPIVDPTGIIGEGDWRRPKSRSRSAVREAPPVREVAEESSTVAEAIFVASKAAGVPKETLIDMRTGSGAILEAAVAWNSSSENLTKEQIATIEAAAMSAMATMNLHRPVLQKSYHSEAELSPPSPSRPTSKRPKSVKSEKSVKPVKPVKSIKPTSPRQSPTPSPRQSREAQEVARGVEETFTNAYNDPAERHRLEDLLEVYNLTLSAPRELELKCNYVQVDIPGVQTTSIQKLNTYLKEHPMNHLAIFSITRNLKMYCFHIEDLQRLLFRATGGRKASDVSEHEWSSAMIRPNAASDLAFTGHECLLILEWYDAFLRLRLMIEGLMGDKNREAIANLKMYADRVVPFVQRTGLWGLLNRAGRAIKRKLENMWKLLSAKFLVDIVACLACVTVFVYATSSAVSIGGVSAAIATIFWPAISRFLFGAIVQRVYQAFVSVVRGGKLGWFEYVMSGVTSGLRALHLGFLADPVEKCALFFLSRKNTQSTPANLELMKGFEVLSKLAPSETVTPTNAAVEGSANILTMLGFSCLMGLGLNQMAQADSDNISITAANLSVLNPFGVNTTGVNPLFGMLASGTMCKLVDSVVGSRNSRLCTYVALNLKRTGLIVQLTLAVIDLLVFLVRITNPKFMRGFLGDTRCEGVFAPFMTPIYTRAGIRGITILQSIS